MARATGRGNCEETRRCFFGDRLVEMLHEGDLLFINSSHIIRPQGDVVFEYLELLPSLESGVFVHVHDVFTPRDYLDEWLLEEKRFWNEQYLLEAILSNSHRYEILLANNYLRHDHPAEFERVCPYLSAGAEPGSLYFSGYARMRVNAKCFPPSKPSAFSPTWRMCNLDP